MIVTRGENVPQEWLEPNVEVLQAQATTQQRILLDALLYRRDVSQIGIGGRRGGGKTWVCCLGVTLRALGYENTEHLCIRRVQKSADLNLGRQFIRVFRHLKLPMGSRRRGQIQWYTKDKYFEFPNGSIIELGFCLKEDDWERYQGREAATVWMAEATQFPELAYRRIGGSNRSAANPDCPGKKLADFNPGGIGHSYCNSIFVDPATRERRTVWIPTGIRDSSAVLEHDPGYVLRTLRGLPDWLRRQWEDGDMDAVAGQYFQVPPDQICKVQVPRHADWYAGVDYGDARPFASLWMARWKEWHSTIDAAGVMRWHSKERAHVAREAYQANLGMDQQAELILETEKTLPLNGKMVVYYADPATGKYTEHLSTEAGRTIRDTWAMFGFFSHPATSNARVPGWKLLKMLLRHGVLTISPECVAFLSELKAAVGEGAPGPPISEDIQQGPNVPDHCLIAGTIVTVRGGDKPIEDVRTGDQVLTRKGWRSVTKAGMTFQDAPVLCLTTSDGRKLIGTGDHPVFVVGKGFTRLDSLRYQQVLYSMEDIPCKANQSYGTGSRSGATQTLRGRRTDGTTGQAQSTSNSVSATCMQRFGKMLTGLYREAITSITSMAIRSITSLRTYSYSLRRSILASIRPLRGQHGHERKSKESAHSQRHGTLLTRDWHGIGIMQQSLNSDTLRMGRGIANCVVSPMRQSRLEAGFVQTTARHDGGCLQGLTTKTGSALFAGRCFGLTAMLRPEHAPVTVRSVCSVGRMPVYDLTVEGEPEFFANGILVHNCLDAVRYVLLSTFGLNYSVVGHDPYDQPGEYPEE